ncbi:hypothetical protein NX059_012380 [Plenodomus lindquistii]|nr:hypothetical protein NX059_012380 [Plenodomus lindquistii]
MRFHYSAHCPDALLTSQLLAAWILRGIYRVYFHPLAGFPGPRLVAFTRLPRNVAVWKGRLHKYVQELHVQYGDVVRVSPDELSFLHPDAWRDIYGHGPGQGKGTRGSAPPKDWLWGGLIAPNGVASVLEEQDPKDHLRVRRIFEPAFSDRALKEQEPLFMKYVDQLVGNLKDEVREQPEKRVDMVKNYNYESKYNPWVSLIFDSIRVTCRFNLIKQYPWLSRLVTANLPDSVRRTRQEHFQYSVDRVSKRIERGRTTEGRDLWDLALTQNKGMQLSRAQMDSNATAFMVAGTETTATLLSGLTYLLLKNPTTMQKLSLEIRGAFADSSDMSMEAIAALPYLAACLKEALRLYPPLPVGLPHFTPANGSTICGRFVPPNTIVGAPQYSMNRDPQNFREPNAFVPERWLGDDKFANDRRHAMQPFSVGSRNCLGQNMALHEIRLIISKVIFNFDMLLCAESEQWADQRVFTLWEKRPLMVKLRDARA